MFGVYDRNDELRQTQLRLGIVGRGEGVDQMDIWLEKCRQGIEAKNSNSPNLFRGFGGFTKSWGFHTDLVYGSALTRTIQKSEINKLMKIKSREVRVNEAVELYFDQIRFLSENRATDVILCIVPDDLFESLTVEAAIEKSSEHTVGDSKSDGQLEHNFRRMIKARSMHLRVPLQLVKENTVTTGKSTKGMQDDATRAWNFCTAVYYKGNKTIPWRLAEEHHKPKTCYVGIGFYKSRDNSTISTSLAQVFDEFGHGVILRGSPVAVDKNDRRPFMSEEQAFDLLNSALAEYEHALLHMPARIVLHKTSMFRPGEIAGFIAALDSRGIKLRDFVTIMPSRLRLFSYETYPPVRGTFLTLNEEKGILYTRGYVDHYKTYPGMYVPNPIEIRLYEHDSSIDEITKEILGLTKMNWNNTQLDGRMPITIECAQSVGEIVKYVDASEKPQVSYSFYM